MILDCNKEVSEKLLGDDAVKDMGETYGKLLTKSYQSPDMIKVDIPDITEEDVKEHINFIINK